MAVDSCDECSMTVISSDKFSMCVFLVVSRGKGEKSGFYFSEKRR
jgi:hypothetical protein